MFGVIFLKMRLFWKKEVIFPKDATVGILEGMPTCTQRHIAPYRLTSSRSPEKLTRAFLHFCVPKFIPFLGILSIFLIFYDFSYFLASKNHKKIKYVESGLQILIG